MTACSVADSKRLIKDCFSDKMMSKSKIKFHCQYSRSLLSPGLGLICVWKTGSKAFLQKASTSHTSGYC